MLQAFAEWSELFAKAIKRVRFIFHGDKSASLRRVQFFCMKGTDDPHLRTFDPEEPSCRYLNVSTLSFFCLKRRRRKKEEEEEEDIHGHAT